VKKSLIGDWLISFIKIEININKMEIKLYNAECLEKLKDLKDNSVDSIVTDPPAGISFMGKAWDGDKGGRDQWIAWMQEIATECNRVLKAGGHALVWAIPRTSHWTATSWENAGFEVRDIVAHIFGTGFPKSLNIGKSVDKLQGNVRKEINYKYQSRIPNGRSGLGISGNNNLQIRKQNGDTKGNSKWEGWGTALKPAREDWILLRKPLSEKTIASNVLKWGCGGINIDGSRVMTEEDTSRKCTTKGHFGSDKIEQRTNGGNTQGRFPANIILDDSDEVLAGFPNTKGKGSTARFFYCAKASKSDRNEGCEDMQEKQKWAKGGTGTGISDRENVMNKNFHPTIKSTKLMQYLVKLITPINGTCLDPFMGSGSTGKACILEGFGFIGIEREEDYFNIAKARINNVKK